MTLTSNAAGTPSQTIANVAPTGLNTSSLNFSQFGINITVNAEQATLAGTITVTAGAGALKFQVGDEANASNQVTLTLGQVNSATLGLAGSLTSRPTRQRTWAPVDAAITALNSDESAVGDAQNQLSYQTANLQTMQTNTQAAESAIKDTNYASAMSTFASSQIATQADVAMLSQANRFRSRSSASSRTE